MYWSIVIGVIVVVLCDSSGLNHESALYLSSLSVAVSWLLGVLAGCGAVAGFVRSSRTADKGGQAYVMRNLHRVRWLLWAAARGLLMTCLAAFFAIYAIEVWLHFSTDRHIRIDSRVNLLWVPTKTTRYCSEYAVFSLSSGNSSPVCVSKPNQSGPLFDPPKSFRTGGLLILHGRENAFGAVVDRIELKGAQPPS